MSAAPLVETAGQALALPDVVIGLSFAGARAIVVCGDGSAHGVEAAAGLVWSVEGVHEGAALCAVARGDGALLTGGDDGRLAAIAADGAVRPLAAPGGWIQALAVAADGRFAAAIGKEAAMFAPDGAALHRFPHAATVEDLAFDPTGRRIAAAHYGGVTLSWAASPESRRKTLEWKGAHHRVAWSPDAKFLVTAMQENALHGWRLQDGKHFRMTGYPAKIRSLAFTADKGWLVTAGAPELVMWPFKSQDGPMGKSAASVEALQAPATAVSPHPSRPVLAAGGADGEVVLVGQDGRGPPILAAAPQGRPVTALGWSGDGALLAFGDEGGRFGLIDLTPAMG